MVLLGLIVCSPFLESKTDYAGENEFYNFNGHQDIDPLLLVTFSNNTLISIKATASPTSYCQRGNIYQSSSYSKWISNEIAEKYDLVKLNE
jgi:hypothetical protein